MNRKDALAWIATVLLAGGGTVHAATANAPETWTNTSTQGWVAYDMVNEEVTAALTVDSGALQLRYAAQSMAMPPDEQVIKADGNASGGQFTGNYLDAGVQGIKFRFKPDLTASASLLLHSDASGRRWRYALTGLTTGVWNDVTVTVAPATLKLMNGAQNWANFAADLQNVSWVGVEVVRNASMAEQFYRLDDFQLVGPGQDFASYIRTAAGGGAWTQDMLATGDLDHDGSDNYSEYVAGTAADVAGDVLAVKIEPRVAAAGVRVSWPSHAGRVYRVLRSTSPGGVDEDISGDLAAGAERNSFDDPADGGGTNYYRVSVRTP